MTDWWILSKAKVQQRFDDFCKTYKDGFIRIAVVPAKLGG